MYNMIHMEDCVAYVVIPGDKIPEHTKPLVVYMQQESLENLIGRLVNISMSLNIVLKPTSDKLCFLVQLVNVFQGSYIPIIVDITANHQGYIEFKICPNNDVFVDPGQSCFDSREPLWVSGGDPILDNRQNISQYCIYL